MATHSSIAKRMPWAEEPGGLQSIGIAKNYAPTTGAVQFPILGMLRTQSTKCCGPSMRL